METILHGDFETRSTCDLKKTGADLYSRHPSTDINCFGFAFNDEDPTLIKRNEPLPQRVTEHILAGGKFVAHNVNFELSLWNNVCAPKYKWPALRPEQTECTMAMSYAMALPGTLEKAAAAMGIDQQKDMAGSRVMLQLAQPREILPSGHIIWWAEELFPEKYQRMYDYCLQDVRVEHELYKRLLKLTPFERDVWILDNEINQRGIQVDVPSLKYASLMVESEKKRLDQLMRTITGNQVASVSANAQLTDWVKAQGVEIEGVAKDSVTTLLLDPTLPEKVRQALLIRQEGAKSSTAKLAAMMSRADMNGRVRGIFQYHAAGTGRWGGRGIQPQNFPRPNLEQEDIEGVFELIKGATT